MDVRISSFRKSGCHAGAELVRGQVIVFLPSFESGGVERNAVYFANAMVAAGFLVHILYCRKSEEWFARLDARVVRRPIPRRLRLPGLSERLVDALNMFVFAVPDVLRVRRAGPAAMISFQSNVVAIALARVCRVPVAVRISNHFIGAEYEGSVIRKFAEFGKRCFYRFADSVIANSSELAADYAPMLHKQVQTIPNPVDIMALRAQMDGELDGPFLHRQRPIVISVGRLVAQKNYALLVEAFSDVVRRVPCDLVILGDGSEKNYLTSLARDLGVEQFVHLLGRRDNVYKYFAHADLFVLSSNYEGMPNALIEAIACGLPAVATRCKTGPSEILCDGAGGRLVPVKDRRALANAIVESLLDPGGARQKHEVAMAQLSRYEEPTVMGKYVALVKNLLGRAK